MKKPKKAWHEMLPGARSPAELSLEELRAAKSVTGFLSRECHAEE